MYNAARYIPPINNQKGFSPIIIGIILLIVVGAGGYYLGTRQNRPATSNSNINQPIGNETVQNILPTYSPQPLTTPSISDWKTYINNKNNFTFQYPLSFSFVQGQIPDSEISNVDGIAIAGLEEPSRSADVVIGIQVNPSDADGNPIQCMTNDDCTNQWMAVLKKNPSEVTSIHKTIVGEDIKGFEYQTKNNLYTQTSQYFTYRNQGKVWQISITMNNYDPQEVTDTIDQILSTFKYSK